MQIELLADYNIINEAFNEFTANTKTIKINNGMFNNKKLYTFIFNGENLWVIRRITKNEAVSK